MLYQLDLDGTNFSVIKDLNEGGMNHQPEERLIASDGNLFSTTRKKQGSVFSIEADGTGFEYLKSFESSDNASIPIGVLACVNNTLYGITQNDRYSNAGAIYSIGTDGSDFQILRQFGITTDFNPRGGLLYAGGKLWGVTSRGGDNGAGGIYTINTDGSDFEVVISFTNVFSSLQGAELIEVGERIFGVSNYCVASIKNDGTEFIIHVESNEFNSYNPNGKLSLINGEIWGMMTGSFDGRGAMFRMNIDGSEFEIVYEFDASNGFYPKSSLYDNGSFLWGTTYSGGSVGGGIVYKLNRDGTGFQKVLDIGQNLGYAQVGGLVQVNDFLYGTTYFGGAGTIYRFKENGTQHEVVYEFDRDLTGYPLSDLLPVGETLYGWSQWIDYGVGSNSQQLYKYDLINESFEVILDYNSYQRPYQNLIHAQGRIYGIIAGHDENDYGYSLFSILPDGSDFSILHNFDDLGPYHSDQLKLTYYKSRIYCPVYDIFGLDVFTGVFSIGINGENPKEIYEFDLDVEAFNYPYGGLVIRDNMIWGTVSQGGLYNQGGVYRLNIDGSEFEIVHSFTPLSRSSINYSTLISVKEIQSLTSFEKISTKVYGAPEFELNAESESVNEIVFESNNLELLTISGNLASVKGSGMVEISAVLQETEIYGEDRKTQVLKIEPADLTVTAENKSMDDGVLPELSMTFDGFVKEDNEAAITLPKISTEATVDSPSGEYDIVLTGGEATNYNLTLINGTLTVTSVEEVLSLIENNELDLSFYPNPAQSYLIFPPSLKIDQVQIFDLEGQKIADLDGGQSRYDIEQLDAGIYNLIIQSGQDRYVQKLLKN